MGNQKSRGKGKNALDYIMGAVQGEGVEKG